MKAGKEYFSYLINSFFYVFRRKKILIHAFVEIRYGKIVKNNWGDDLNVFMIEMMTGHRVVVANKSLYHILFNRKGYLCVGSILGFVGFRESIAWGTGSFGYSQPILSDIPHQINSVRGPKTKELLESLGYPCPARFGDPALLLSKYYKPKKGKRYKMGIVPHVSQRQLPFILEFAKYFEDVLIVDLKNYKCWTDVIDKIASCEFVISSSLHGLIVADSYEIPNIWVKFPVRLAGDDFKFHDYLSSVHRECTPMYIDDIDGLHKIYRKGEDKNDAVFDYRMIIESCPFKHLLLPIINNE